MDSLENKDRLHVLIVDDETNIRKTLSYCLSSEGHRVGAVSNAGDAVEEVKRHFFDMAFVDLKLGGEDGLNLTPLLLSEAPWLKVVVITAYATIETAVEAMRRGATDYIAKPFNPDQVRLIVKKISQLRKLEQDLACLKEDISRVDPALGFQTRNAAMQMVIEMARKAALSNAIVLLRGESGTGKIVLARAIHHWSLRRGQPMAVISCPAIPTDLLESELFGHVKGAFTGATYDHPGRIAMCEVRVTDSSIVKLEDARVTNLEATLSEIRVALEDQQQTEFVETASGSRADRRIVAQAIATARRENAALIVVKIDRLARDAAFLMALRNSGLDILAGDMPELNTLSLGILATVAQAELERISQRQREAKAELRRRGKFLGGLKKGQAPKHNQEISGS